MGQRTMVKRTLCNGETALPYPMRSVTFSSLELHPGFLSIEADDGAFICFLAAEGKREAFNDDVRFL